MTDTPNLGLPYIDGSQAQKHVTHNEALRILDAAVQIGVLDLTLTAPPSSPAEGERHVVARAFHVFIESGGIPVRVRIWFKVLAG